MGLYVFLVSELFKEIDMPDRHDAEPDPLAELARLIGGYGVEKPRRRENGFVLLAEVILEKLRQKRLVEEKSKINHRTDWRW